MSETVATPKNTPRNYKYLDGPTLVRRAEASYYLWGDEKSGQVNDIIYGRNERIGCVIFTLWPGGYYKTSEDWRPYNDQHRFYYVLRGQLTVHDPQTGDVACAEAGEAIHWRGARWHFAYNFSQEETAVLDWYAPHSRPLDQVLAEEGKGKPKLDDIRNGRYDLVGKWPSELCGARQQAFRNGSPVTLSRREALHLIHGKESQILESLYVSTEELTAGVVDLMPGIKAEAQSHPGEKIIFATKGRLNVYLPSQYAWFELDAMDVLYLPGGVEHQYWNYTGTPSQFAFLVVPQYR